jgi:hypothetical protein
MYDYIDPLAEDDGTRVAKKGKTVKKKINKISNILKEQLLITKLIMKNHQNLLGSLVNTINHITFVKLWHHIRPN